jgi:site-specific DNA-methyltransferase (adenine-specific)
MRQIVRASLPLGKGTVLDPFMGGGSTIAAAVAVGYQSVGIEIDPQFFDVALEAIPGLAALPGNGTVSSRTGSKTDLDLQRSLALPLEP